MPFPPALGTLPLGPVERPSSETQWSAGGLGALRDWPRRTLLPWPAQQQRQQQQRQQLQLLLPAMRGTVASEHPFQAAPVAEARPPDTAPGAAGAGIMPQLPGAPTSSAPSDLMNAAEPVLVGGGRLDMPVEAAPRMAQETAGTPAGSGNAPAAAGGAPTHAAVDAGGKKRTSRKRSVDALATTAAAATATATAAAAAAEAVAAAVPKEHASVKRTSSRAATGRRAMHDDYVY